MKKKLFNFLTFSLFNFSPLLAATSPLASTNDYYYTTPKTTNICGRVMGENGDYKLVRAEDLAFINEALAERYVLSGYTSDTNATAEGTLVEGKYRHVAPSTIGYWNRAPLSACALTNTYHFYQFDALTEASGGAMTNIATVITNARPHKLVTMGWITNNFATLKKMNCLVAQPLLSSTSDAVEIETTIVKSKDGGGYTLTTTNTITLAAMQLHENGAGYNTEYYDGDRSKTTVKRICTGSGAVRLSFGVADTNAWLRGEEKPKVVSGARAWGVFDLESKYETDLNNNYDEGSTNATVIIDLGEARWVCATTNSQLVYEIDVDIREVYASCVSVAPWMPSLSEVESTASVPPLPSGPEDDTRSSSQKKKAEMDNVWRVYLVLDLKPVASLEEWGGDGNED